MQIDGSGRVHAVQSLPVLRPDEQVLQLMLEGWRNQQLSRNLQFATIEQRLRCVLRSIDHVNVDPWHWKIGSAHVCTPVINAHLVCRLLIEKKQISQQSPASNIRSTDEHPSESTSIIRKQYYIAYIQ